MKRKPRASADDPVRLQKVKVCEVAKQRGVQQGDETVLRWFTTEILHFPWSWNVMVVMALLDKTKAGEYRWRTARNPLGLVRVIAQRLALKESPELLFGNDADRFPATGVQFRQNAGRDLGGL